MMQKIHHPTVVTVTMVKVSIQGISTYIHVPQIFMGKCRVQHIIDLDAMGTKHGNKMPKKVNFRMPLKNPHLVKTIKISSELSSRLC